jgi:hypothetical protein
MTLLIVDDTLFDWLNMWHNSYACHDLRAEIHTLPFQRPPPPRR